MSFHLYVLFHVQGLPVNALKKGVYKVLDFTLPKKSITTFGIALTP